MEEYQMVNDNQFSSYKYLINSAPIGIFTSRSDGKPLSINPELAKMLGYANGEEVLNNYQDLAKDLYANFERREELIKQLEEHGEVLNFEFRATKAEGELIWLSMNARMSKKNSDGTFLISGFTTDITKEKIAEQELIDSEKKYRQLAETVHAILWEYNIVNDSWDYVAPQSEEILGYKPQEWKDYNFWKSKIHPDDRDWAVKYCANCLAKGEDHVLEYRFIKKNGEIAWLRDEVNVEVIDGEARFMRGFMLDITEQKEQEYQINFIRNHDPLTELYNRTYLEEKILLLDVKEELPISIIMADLNGLKMINDTYGHSVGDEILVETAKILKNGCDKTDLIARWGGDEFLILLPQTNYVETQKIIRQIKNLCKTTANSKIPISIAMGIGIKVIANQKMHTVLNKAEANMNQNKLIEIRSTKNHILKELLKNLDKKTFETEEHTWRMQKLAFAIAEKISISPKELERLSLLVTLHDIGMTIVPEGILYKDTSLTLDEWKMVKKHPETGARIAASTTDFAHISKELLSHHEHWNGAGYPQGLKGDKIPYLARMLAIIDAYDVMVTGRPYKRAVSKNEALEEISSYAGKQFDPKLVNKFMEVMEI